eukprot:2480782-Pyramimonas_sp.AAC.3
MSMHGDYNLGASLPRSRISQMQPVDDDSMSLSASMNFDDKDTGPYLDADEYFVSLEGKRKEPDELNWQAHHGPKLKASFSLLAASAIAQIKATGNFLSSSLDSDDISSTKRLDVPVGLPLKT